MTTPSDAVYRRICELVAAVLDLEPAQVEALPPSTPLLTGGLGLTSVRGAALLVSITDRLGVDVAAQDLSLASLSTLQTLADFVRAHRAD